jgi:hypothetical protein
MPRSVHMVQTIQREFWSPGAKADRRIAKSIGSVHLSLMDNYRCAHNGQHPYLFSFHPDGFNPFQPDAYVASETADLRFNKTACSAGRKKGRNP